MAGDADAYIEFARQEFRAFYSAADTADAAKFDRLLHLHRVLGEAYKVWSVPGVPPTQHNERAAMHEFLRTRFDVQSCGTFNRLCLCDQKRIEAILFNPFPPTE